MLTLSIESSVVELAARQHGLVALWQLEQLGLPVTTVRSRIRSRRWERAGTGVYRIAGAPTSRRQRLMVVVLAAGSEAAAAFEAAAWLWQIPGFPFTVAAVRPRQRCGRRNPENVFESCDLPPSHVQVADGITVTTPERTLVDLAGRVPLGRTARALDWCLGASLVSVPSVVAVHDRLARQGRPGIVAMRVLLQERGDGYFAQSSELERRFLRLVRANDLPLPEQQVSLGSREKLAGRVDFVYRSAQLVIEVDGRRWHSSLLDRENDMRRDAEIARSVGGSSVSRGRKW